jgi:hypothetical protein
MLLQWLSEKKKPKPAVMEPPGELINNVMSLVWSSASNSKSWLIIRSALVSSTYISQAVSTDPYI